MEPALVGFRQRPMWLVAVAALLLAQGYLTVGTFGGWSALCNDEPITTGQHPLHLYHGWLGINRWIECGTSCCFDPAFQAGYPKTPVFDDGSRPAELFLWFTGGRFSPSAYKFGIALCCLFAPLAFIVMARGMGLSPASACLAGLIGIALWWSAPVRQLVMLGDFDLLLGGFCVLIYLHWLVRFDRWPGLVAWLVLMLTGCVGWYTDPLLWVGFMPLAMLFYLWAGGRQGIGWHLALIAATITGIAVNAFWLWEWVRFWWIVAQDLRDWPPFLLTLPQGHELIDVFREQPINATVITLGLLGLLVCLYRRHIAASLLMGVSIILLLFIVRLGRHWEPLAAMGSAKLMVMAGWFAVCPCAALLAQVAKVILSGRQHPVRVGAVGLVFTAIVLSVLGPLDERISSTPKVTPFDLGFTPAQLQTMQQLREQTSATARILWQESPGDKSASRWSALLPLRTERTFLGGLDANAGVEHMFATLTANELAGRPLGEWTDADLTRFMERYNVGWIVCSSPASIARFREYPHARESNPLALNGDAMLFTIQRNHSYLLKGHGSWVQADGQRIALSNVTPEDGVVTLSMHYQTGWLVSPSYVRIERELDPHDPIPLIRLRMPGPVARLTLSWENP